MRICGLGFGLMAVALGGCYTPSEGARELDPLPVGALIGCTLDPWDMRILRECAPTTARKIELHEHLAMEDIEKMSRLGISDEKIIATIDETGSIYHLRIYDIEDLEDEGVSDYVIDYMLFTSTRVPLRC